MPISLIRSVTDTNIIFIIPIPATNKAITLTEKANIFTPPVNEPNVSISSVLEVISKSFSLSGGTLRIALIIPITSS